MPDSLSKTVPIWVAVINRLLFPGNELVQNLATPVEWVHCTEHEDITTKLDSFVRDAEVIWCLPTQIGR